MQCIYHPPLPGYCLFVLGWFHHKHAIHTLTFYAKVLDEKHCVFHDSCLQLCFPCSTNTLLFTSLQPSCNSCINFNPFDTVINLPYDSIINPLWQRLNNETYLSRESWFIKQAGVTLPAMEQIT